MISLEAVPEADRLLAAARTAMANAHAPYSRFRVGAAVLDAEGVVHRGSNVENASFGLTMCAEQVAASTAVSAGARSLLAIGIVSDADQPVSPCGACRQFLAEFADDSMPIVSATAGRHGGKTVAWRLGELMPRAFREVPV